MANHLIDAFIYLTFFYLKRLSKENRNLIMILNQVTARNGMKRLIRVLDLQSHDTLINESFNSLIGQKMIVD